MKVRLDKVSRRPDWSGWAVVTGAVWLLLVGAIWVLDKLNGTHFTLCHFKRVTGLPCPTCGTTRMVENLATGHPVQAVLMNPFVFGLWLVLVSTIALRIGFGRKLVVDMPRRQKKAAWITLGVLFLANWVLLICLGR